MEPMTAESTAIADHMAVYARRKARMVFLRHHVEGGHPVLTTEGHLVEMARSKLLESLLAEHGEAGIAAARPAVESRIREVMRKSVNSLVSDPAARKKLCEEMDLEPLDQAFTPRSS